MTPKENALELDLSTVSDAHLAALFAAVSGKTDPSTPVAHQRQTQDWLVLVAREIHRRVLARRLPITDPEAPLPF